MITILIIEDEIKTAKELKADIEKSAFNVVVLAIIQTVKGAIKWLRENDAPDLIFSDIQLADGLSFEIYKQIEVKSAIIFCTAFDEYAIEAFKTRSIDYLLKPIDEVKLQQSIAKYHQMKSLFVDGESANTKVKNLLFELNNDFKRTILVHYQEKIIPLKTSDIAYFHYELGNVSVMTFDKKKYFLNQTLDEFENVLYPVEFFRANRQFIINRKAVLSIENYFSRRLLLQLIIPVPEDIIVSKIKASQLLRWIEKT